MHTSAIKTIADHLVATARAAGVHVTITTVSLQPPAMGNYNMLVDVRPAHPNSAAAVIVHASGKQELLQAENAIASESGYEVQRAVMEGERNAAVQAYLDARDASLDNIHNRKMLEAGFDRGWDAALAAHHRSST